MGFGFKDLLEPDQGLFPNDNSYALANPGGYATAKTRQNRTGSGTGGVGQGVVDGPPVPVDTLLTAGGMPSLTDADRRNASRKARAALLARGGRASTILTDDPLGGGL